MNPIHPPIPPVDVQTPSPAPSPTDPSISQNHTTPNLTAGTEQLSTSKKWLPRLIIAAILINVVPTFLIALYPDYSNDVESARNVANIILIVFFIVIIVKMIGEKNAKN